MRKIYFLLTAGWLFCALSVCAQSPTPLSVAPVSDTLRKKLNLVFSPLDKSQVPTKYLEQYGNPLIPLDLFNNTLTDSSRTNALAFRFLYATLSSSRIYGTSSMPTLATVNTRITNIEKTYPKAIPIAVLRWDYATLRPDAVSANLLRVQNDQLYDVAGRTQSPYLTKTVFAAAPSRSYSNSGTVSFVFHQDVTLTSGTPLTLSNIYIDLGTGLGYQGIGFGTPITASYTTKGSKRIKVKFRYSTGLEMQSHFDLEVLNPACPGCRYDLPIDDVPVPPAADGSHSGGTIQIRRADTHTQLVKPLIIVEGYDPFFAAPALAPDYRIEDFIRQITLQPTSYNFRDALDNIGDYDLIFINYTNGTDDIRRNAALFREVIAWVNQNKVGTEQNVVMGLSMGGLVARYGLAEMVKAGLNPQTKLLITHDSPHRGANTPLGTQALTRQAIINVSDSYYSTADLSPSLDQANRLLDAPASRQLLILRATDGDGGVVANTFMDGEYRTMITFNGGPQPNYRMIATSLGSQCGNGSLAPYAELVRSAGEYYISPIPWIRRNSLKMDIIVNALPPLGQSKRISYLRVYVNYRIAVVISINFNLLNKSYMSPANTLPWDGLAGGTLNVKDQAGDEIPTINKKILWFLKKSLNTYLADDFCFVPTPSALDIADINATTVQATYVGGISSASLSRMGNFIAQERSTDNGPNPYNKRHITFTNRNSEWLFNQMEGTTTTLNCSTECNPFASTTIGGSATICNGSSYSINPIANATYTWSVSSNITINAGQGTANLTVKPNGSGSGTISLVVGKNGCSFPIQAINVQVGTVTASQLSMKVNSQEIQYLCPNSSYIVDVSGPSGTTFDTWTFQGLSGSGTGSYANISTSSTFGGGSISVVAHDACGGSTVLQRTVSRSSTCSMMLAMFPNPADSYVEVSFSSNDSAEDVSQSLPEEYEVIIYNKLSQKVKDIKSKQKKQQIKLEELPEDIYYVHLIYQGETIKKQLIIKH
jgi:alpha/beta superfamily hydrolase